MRETKRRRRRGVFLSNGGINRVHDGQRRLADDLGAVRVSHEALSTAVGVSVRTLSRVFRRESPVDLRTLDALFVALRLELDRSDYVYVEAAARYPACDFPERFSTLIGRDEVLDRLERLLSSSRLLTLTGSGGIGKTRVALELASRQRVTCEKRLWFVDLASVRDSGEIRSSVAMAFGILAEESAMFAAVREQLGDEPGILVLDSCEHHVATLEPCVMTLLRTCPSLRIIATSRESLGAEGERILRISPLEMPGCCKGITAAEAIRYPAVALFAQRAGTQNDSFVFDDRSAPVVSEIVRRLDGLPLAIELAAARVAVMSLDDLSEHLRGRVTSLAADAPQQNSRHRSLTTLLDWSFDRLTEDERLVCRRASAFAGVVDVSALQIVCGDSLAPDAVARAVFQLVRKSLLESDTRSGRTRYFFLDTVRECAQERLDASNDSAFARWLHALHYTCLSGQIMKSFGADDQIEALRSMTREYANITRALEWCFTLSRNEHIGAVLVSELPEYWDARGQYRAGEAWIRRALAVDGALVARTTSAKLFEGLSLLLFRQARLKEAAAAANSSLSAFRAVADDVGLCRARNLLGIISLEAGDAEFARRQYSTNLETGETLGNARTRIVALNNLGRIEAEVDGDKAAALRHFQESLKLASGIGLQTMVAMALRNVAETHADVGDLSLAIAFSRRGMEASRALENDALYCIQAVQTAIYRIRDSGLKSALAELDIALAAIASDPYRIELCGQLETIARMLIEGGEPARGVILLAAATEQRLGTQTLAGKAGQARHGDLRETARKELGAQTYGELEAFGGALPLEAAFRAALFIATPPSAVDAVSYARNGASTNGDARS